MARAAFQALPGHRAPHANWALAKTGLPRACRPVPRARRRVEVLTRLPACAQTASTAKSAVCLTTGAASASGWAAWTTASSRASWRQRQERRWQSVGPGRAPNALHRAPIALHRPGTAWRPLAEEPPRPDPVLRPSAPSLAAASGPLFASALAPSRPLFARPLAV